MESELTSEAKATLRYLPNANKLMRTVREQLPDGTHFGIMVLAPNGHIIALTTDRDVVAPAIGAWVMDVLEPEPDHD